MCSIDKSIDKVSQYFWYRDTKKYRGIRDTSIVKFWYRDISKYRQYRPSLLRAVLCLLRPAWSGLTCLRRDDELFNKIAASYIGALKNFGTPWLPTATFPKNFHGLLF